MLFLLGNNKTNKNSWSISISLHPLIFVSWALVLRAHKESHIKKTLTESQVPKYFWESNKILYKIIKRATSTLLLSSDLTIQEPVKTSDVSTSRGAVGRANHSSMNIEWTGDRLWINWNLDCLLYLYSYML